MQRAIDPTVVFGTYCATFEETSYRLLQLVAPEELTSGQTRWRRQRWNELKEALEQGWDPQESISIFLDDFYLSLGNGMFRCLAPENGGGTCGRDEESKDRTISHVCEHLGYDRYACSANGNWWGGSGQIINNPTVITPLLVLNASPRSEHSSSMLEGRRFNARNGMPSSLQASSD